MKKLDHELDLTETQRVEVEKILERLETKLHELKQKHQPELKAVFDHNFDMIKEKLDQEQRSKLDEIREKMRKRHPPRKDKSR